VRAFVAVTAAVATTMRTRFTAAAIGPTTATAAAPHFARVETAAANALTSLVDCAVTML
jgi:hypothetical protein